LSKHFSDQLNKNIWVIRWKLFILPGKFISTCSYVTNRGEKRLEVKKIKFETLIKIFLLKQKNCEWISPLRIKNYFYLNSRKIYLRKLKFLTRTEERKKILWIFTIQFANFFHFTQTFPKEV
jgi:hypothetical protein